MYLLPASKEKVKRFLGPRKTRYKLATVVDLILIVLILINGKQPAQRLISPLVSSVHSTYSKIVNKTTRETFAFVPDLASNKFPSIDVDNLTYLSFFDIPLTADGEINQDSRGYTSVTSDKAAELFDRARYQKTKILLTLSALDKDTITNILDSDLAKQNLAGQAIDEIKNLNIDGIVIDFEAPQVSLAYQKKFTDFIKFLNTNIHSAIPEAKVAVAVPNTMANNQSLYNIEGLAPVSDRLFLIASDFIVPEVKNLSPSNPVYGYNENDYFTNISNLLSNLQTRVPANKLVMERAWYGNGNNYPLYKPDSNPGPEETKQPSAVSIDQATLEKLVAGVPTKGRGAARRNIPLIAKALDEEGILDSNVLAYALATVEHETDDTFEPIEEIQGRINARRRGYEGGTNYFGRGFIQITHLRNYREFGRRIGMGDGLVKNPDLANTPKIAAKILAAFFKDNNVANLASRGNFVAARIPINPDYNGWSVANLAMKYEVN